MSDCLWASLWLSKDHEEFNRVAVNKSFPRTLVFMESVQRQAQTLINRKDTYNMQVSQDWKTFRWSRITLLSDTATEWIRMKVHVCSNNTLRVLESQIQIHPTIGQQSLMRCGTKTEWTKN